jgi:hypothetical protein
MNCRWESVQDHRLRCRKQSTTRESRNNPSTDQSVTLSGKEKVRKRNNYVLLALTFKRYVVPPIRTMQRNFNDWWKTVPGDLRDKARKGDESNKPLLNQVNYALLHLHLAGKHDAKPSHEELKEWLHTGQVDVLRTNK